MEMNGLTVPDHAFLIKFEFEVGEDVLRHEPIFSICATFVQSVSRSDKAELEFHCDRELWWAKPDGRPKGETIFQCFIDRIIRRVEQPRAADRTAFLHDFAEHAKEWRRIRDKCREFHPEWAA